MKGIQLGLIPLVALVLLVLSEADGYYWQQCPSDVIQPRLSHTSLYAPSLGSILVYGGLNNFDAVAYGDLWAYDPEARTWEQLSTQAAPVGRYGHSASLVGNEMIVIGGDNISHLQSDVWALDLGSVPPLARFKTRAWRLVLEGNATLTGHSAVVTKTGVIYIFGGLVGGVRSSDVYTLYGGTWSRIDTNGGPSRRWKHSAVIVGNSMWIFGGQDDSNIAINDLHCLDFPSGTWQSFNTTVPPRYGHTAVLSPDGKSMIIHGGHNGMEFLNDLWKLDFDTGLWQQLPLNGSAPSRRNSHSALTWRNITGQNHMFTLGGVSVFGPKNDAFLLDLGKLPAIEARTTAQRNNLVLLFSNADSPDHRLIPTDKVVEELHIDFKFLDFSEVTELGSAVRTITFPSSGFTLTQGGSSTLTQQFNFTTTIPEGVVGLDYSLFSNETAIQYGNVTLKNLPGTNKWNLNLQGWRFMNQSNRIELRVKLAVDQKGHTITSVSNGIKIASQRTTRYLVQTTKATLTIDLADFVLIDDGLDQPVYHRFEGRDLLVISLPYFGQRLTYDPNFGLLIGGDNRRSYDPCGSDGFNMWWIICLAAAGVIVPALVVGGAIIYIRHQRKKAAHRALIQERIRAFTKVEEERTRKTTMQETPASVV